MVSVRKRWKVYEYRFETASVDGTKKWITKSGFRTKQEARTFLNNLVSDSLARDLLIAKQMKQCLLMQLLI